MNFNCKDEAEAKNVYSKVFTNDMKTQLIMDNDITQSYFGTDCAVAVYKDTESSTELTYAYYRVGNNVLAVSQCTFDLASEGVKPINYKKQFDYKAELDKLCKAFGAAKLPSSVTTKQQ